MTTDASRHLVVVFDHGGGTLVQTTDWVHHFDDPSEAALCTGYILAYERNPDDGDDPDFRISYTEASRKRDVGLAYNSEDLVDSLDYYDLPTQLTTQEAFLIALKHEVGLR